MSGAARLLRGRPRNLAALVFVGAGTMLTPAMSWLFVGSSIDILHDVAFFEPFVLTTAAWSYLVYGPRILCESSPIGAILLGAICVLLGTATGIEGAMLLDLIWQRATSPSFAWPSLPEIIDNAIDGGIVLTIVGSALARFVPELVGALSGYVVWRLARPWVAV